ncbi:MAG: hypothetical protein M1491_02600 [Deltaproteobacteria bacterium]|nr:hypothetical protein [Deltaproteobacteria bacterium]MCL5278218.1 hypothetical protein [Deltaproteobacteria bacterium]
MTKPSRKGHLRLRRDIATLFRQLRNDNTSGSSEIASNAIRRIKSIVGCADAGASAHLFTLISEGLVSAQPSMGIMMNLADGIAAMTYAPHKDMLSYLDGFRAAMEDHARVIARRTAPLLKGRDTVMTYSSSSTVLESLKYAYRNGARFKVAVPESRPMNEGKAMAAGLSKTSIPVLYMTDAACMSMLAAGDIDAVLIGGDAIHMGDLVCKTGSLAIAALCKAGKVPLYGLCATEKIVPRRFNGRFVIVDRPAGEVSDIKNSSLRIANRYFERVPLHMFTRVVTDGGEQS